MQLIVGRITKAHGIRGEVLVEVRTDDPVARFAVGSVLVTDPAAVGHPVPDRGRTGPAVAVPPTLTIEAVRSHQGRLIVVFEGVYDRNLAEELRGVLLCVDSTAVPPTGDPDEFNDFELVGLTAVDTAGQPIGEVVRIDHALASDLLVLRLPDGRTGLVPFVTAIVPEVDVAGGRVVLDPPEGLFDL
jgi:16S rRNA processing protein RimM